MKFVLHKAFPAVISDKNEVNEAIDDFGLNPCKATAIFKKDKSTVKKAINKDPYAVMYADDSLKKDPEIVRLVKEKKAYCKKFVDPVSDAVSIEEIDGKTLEKIKLRNSLVYEKQVKIELVEKANEDMLMNEELASKKSYKKKKEKVL